MAESKTEGVISRSDLAAHGISYDEAVCSPHVLLPEHVDAVRKTLLSFESLFVPGPVWQEKLEREAIDYAFEGATRRALYPPDPSVLKPFRGPRKAALALLRTCQRTAGAARDLAAGSTDTWAQFWRREVFTAVHRHDSKQPGFHVDLQTRGDTALTSPSPATDRCTLNDECDLKESITLQMSTSDAQTRSHPKPDLTYATPIAESSGEHYTGSTRWPHSNTTLLQSIANLCRTCVTCTSTAGLHERTEPGKPQLPRSADPNCFPWAVFQLGDQAQGTEPWCEEQNYCQAANTSAAALNLHAQTSPGTSKDSAAVITPVITFTCVGPRVNVWLTYFLESDTNGERARRMTCIWSTSALLTWGLTTLRVILANMHTWSTRFLKRKLDVTVLKVLEQTRPLPGIERVGSITDLHLPGSFPNLGPEESHLPHDFATKYASPEPLIGHSTPRRRVPDPRLRRLAASISDLHLPGSFPSPVFGETDQSIVELRSPVLQMEMSQTATQSISGACAEQDSKIVKPTSLFGPRAPESHLTETQWNEIKLQVEQAYLRLLDTAETANCERRAFAALIELIEKAPNTGEATQVNVITALSRRTSGEITQPHIKVEENDDILTDNIRESVELSEPLACGKDDRDGVDLPLKLPSGPKLSRKGSASSNRSSVERKAKAHHGSGHLSAPEANWETYETHPEEFYAANDNSDTKESSEKEILCSRCEASKVEKMKRAVDKDESLISNEENDGDEYEDADEDAEEDDNSAHQTVQIPGTLFSLTGPQLVQAFNGGALFLSRNRTTQVAMIQAAVGTGPMEGDQYYHNGRCQLKRLLKALDAPVRPTRRIDREQFHDGKVADVIQDAVAEQIRSTVTDEERWKCCRLALRIRSQPACSRILGSAVWDFTAREWTALARRADCLPERKE